MNGIIFKPKPSIPKSNVLPPPPAKKIIKL